MPISSKLPASTNLAMRSRAVSLPSARSGGDARRAAHVVRMASRRRRNVVDRSVVVRPHGVLLLSRYTAETDRTVSLENGVDCVANVNAELNGVVWEIIVAAGDNVGEGTELMILESMKMEIPVVSPSAGTVASIDVESGASVTKGQLLLTLDPA